MRMFRVIISIKGKATAYPPQDGNRALANMLVLARRGFEPVARTEANGIAEDLTLPDMQSIYPI